MMNLGTDNFVQKYYCRPINAIFSIQWGLHYSQIENRLKLEKHVKVKFVTVRTCKPHT